MNKILSQSLEALCWADRADYDMYSFRFDAIYGHTSFLKLDEEAYRDFYKMLDRFYERQNGVTA